MISAALLKTFLSSSLWHIVSNFSVILDFAMEIRDKFMISDKPARSQMICRPILSQFPPQSLCYRSTTVAAVGSEVRVRLLGAKLSRSCQGSKEISRCCVVLSLHVQALLFAIEDLLKPMRVVAFPPTFVRPLSTL